MAVPGGVEHLRPGMPGYRLRLPQDVHPVSAGLKGGIVGGAAMPVPALLWGLLSGHGLWYPVNLLAGMVLPGVGRMTVPELEQFNAYAAGGGAGHPRRDVGGHRPDLRRAAADAAGRPPADRLGRAAHAPPVDGGELRGDAGRQPGAAGESRAGRGSCSRSSSSASRCRPWSWGPSVFQAARRSGGRPGRRCGHALPAVLWAAASGRGFWYPVNLLAGMLLPGPGNLDGAELGRFHPDWFLAAGAIHAVLSIGFGVLFALLTPRLPPMPGPIAWGGLVLPLVWTGISYGLMGVVNPVLQERVDWAWFIVSQFVFGVAAAVVVLRSEKVSIPPAGLGPDRVADFVAGEGGGRS